MLRVFLSVCTFLLALVACTWATVAICRGPIERDLAKRTLEELEQIDGFRQDLCQITFNGRDGQLSGEVQSQALKEAVEQQLRNLYGTRLVRTELAVRPFDAPWIMVARQEEPSDGFRVTGLLPPGSSSAPISVALGNELEIDWQVEVRDRVDPTPWLPHLVRIAGEFLPMASSGVAEVRDGKLTLHGEVSDPAAEKRFIASANSLFTGPGLSTEFTLSIAPPPEPASFQMFPEEDGQIIVAGRLSDLDSAQQLLTLLRSSGNWIIKDQIVVAENTAPAPWLEGLTLLLPSVLTEVIAAGVKIEGTHLRLEGHVSEDMSVAISEVAAQNFPSPTYQIQNRIRLVTPPREAMVSVLTYPGSVQLKGLLPETGQKDRIVEAVKGAMEGGELSTDELQVDPNVMEAPWVGALTSLVPHYVRKVERGGLTIYSNILAVEAVIDSDADRDFIWAMTEQFFPDDKYRRLLELRFPEEVEGGIAAEVEGPGLDEKN